MDQKPYCMLTIHEKINFRAMLDRQWSKLGSYRLRIEATVMFACRRTNSYKMDSETEVVSTPFPYKSGWGEII
jgi:hypothetical protein